MKAERAAHPQPDPWLEAQRVAQALVGSDARLTPWRAPDGGDVPFLFLHAADNAHALLLIHDGAPIPPGGGLDAADAWLRAIGEPRAHRLSRLALIDVLRYFNALDAPWLGDTRHDANIDALADNEGLERPSLQRHDEGAFTLTLEAWLRGPFGGGYMPRQRYRLALHMPTTPPTTLTLSAR